MVVLFNFIMWWFYSISLCGGYYCTHYSFKEFHYEVVLFNFIMWWFYLISLCGGFIQFHYVVVVTTPTTLLKNGLQLLLFKE